jgi:hypothetical protein
MCFTLLTALCLIAACHPLHAEPRVLAIGLAVSSSAQTAAPLRPPVPLQDPYHALEHGQEALRDLFVLLGRFRTVPQQARMAGRRSVYDGAQSVEYVAHLIVHRFGKIYRNRILGRGRSGPDTQPLIGGSTEETLSEPAIFGRCELRLVRAEDQDVIWSGMRDTTLLIPCDRRVAIFNPEIYPGRTHPVLLREHLSGMVRLQHADASVGNMLRSADIWLVSGPDDDAATARKLMRVLIAAFAADADGHLPLTGSVSGLLPVDGNKQMMTLDLGARHGLAVGMRLDVQRPESGHDSAPSSSTLPLHRIGQIQITSVDSTRSRARVRKLTRRLRRQGGGVERGDIVVSRRRRLPQDWPHSLR